MRRHTQRKHRKTLRKTKRYNRKRYNKKGGMAPPISDAATYSYPPYFPNKTANGKDVWPVEFKGSNIKDIDVPSYKQFPLAADTIIDVKEQAGINNLKVQSGGYIYDPKLLKKLKQAKHHRYMKNIKPAY